jgi:hypothetical protein
MGGVEIPGVKLLLSLLMLLAVGACATDEPTSSPSHDLGEPWQAEPFAIDQATISAATEACRHGQAAQIGQVGPALPPLVAVDARGANTVIVAFAQPGISADCTLVRAPDGHFDMVGGGSGMGMDEHQPLGSREVRSSGWGSTSFGVAGQPATYMIGRAGPEIAKVEIVVPPGQRIRASLASTGWFVAWWPGDSTNAKLMIFGYDALGTPVAQGS